MTAVIEWEEEWHPGEVAKAKHTLTEEHSSAWGAWVWEENKHKASCLEPKSKLSCYEGGPCQQLHRATWIKMSFPD